MNEQKLLGCLNPSVRVSVCLLGCSWLVFSAGGCRDDSVSTKEEPVPASETIFDTSMDVIPKRLWLEYKLKRFVKSKGTAGLDVYQAAS